MNETITLGEAQRRLGEAARAAAETFGKAGRSPHLGYAAPKGKRLSGAAKKRARWAEIEKAQSPRQKLQRLGMFAPKQPERTPRGRQGVAMAARKASPARKARKAARRAN